MPNVSKITERQALKPKLGNFQWKLAGAENGSAWVGFVAEAELELSAKGWGGLGETQWM